MRSASPHVINDFRTWKNSGIHPALGRGIFREREREGGKQRDKDRNRQIETEREREDVNTSIKNN